MTTSRYTSGLGGVTPTGALVASSSSPSSSSSSSRDGRVLGTALSPTNPVTPGSPVGIPIAGDGNPLGNPNFPCVAGPEILPMDSTSVPVDRGTVYFQDHRLPATALGIYPQYAVAGYKLTATRQQHAVSYDYYSRGLELPIDEPQLFHCPLYAVNTTAFGVTTATTSAGTFLNALTTPGGDQAILNGNTTNPYVALHFDTSEIYNNYPNGRVTRIGIRYLAWKDETAQPGIAEGLGVYYFDLSNGTTTSKFYASWAVPNYQSDTQYETRWLGETNFCALQKNNAWDKHPFTVDDLYRMRSGVANTGIVIIGQPGWVVNPNTALLDGKNYLDFIELVVEIVPERRTMAAIRILSNISGTTYSSAYTKENEFRYALSSYNAVLLSGVSPTNLYTMGIREAIPADPSDRFRVAPPSYGGFLYSEMEAIGPSVQLPGVTVERDVLDGQISTRVAPISDGVLAGTPVSFDQYNLGATVRDATYLTNGAWWPAYERLSYNGNITVYGSETAQQRIYVDGSTQFSYVRLLARPDDVTVEDLTIRVQQPYGVDLIPPISITAAGIRALPDVGNGWREFGVSVTPFTPATGYLWVILESPSGYSLAPWYIAGALSVGNQCWTGYDPTCDPQPLSYPQDLAVTLMCTEVPIPAPTVTVVTATIDQTYDSTCKQISIDTTHLAWISNAQYEEYGIFRSSNGGAFYLIGVVDNPTSPVVLTYDDLGAPWDIPVTYQIRGWRQPFNQIVVGSSAAPVQLQSYGAVIGLSSEGGNGISLVYVPVDSSQVELEWTDLTTSEIATLSGENFHRGLHAPEDRGLSLRLNVLVAHITACSVNLGTVGSVGALSLSPDPFDNIRRLSRKPWVNVRIPGGPWRQMILSLGPLSVRTAAGVYTAQIILTDARAPRVFAGEAPQ